MYEEKKKKEIKPEEKIKAVKELMVGEISQEKIGKNMELIETQYGDGI